jgi:exonuclease VII small subunit
MPSKEEISNAIKVQFANVRERGKILAQALKARADIAATRRRLRLTFADLGEAIYTRLESGELELDSATTDFKLRIEGLKAELRQREGALKSIVEGDDHPPSNGEK